MLKSTIGIIKALALAAACLNLVASTHFALESQVTRNRGRSDAIGQVGPRPPYLSASSQKYSTDLVGLNVLAGLPAPKAACPPADFDAHAPESAEQPQLRGRRSAGPVRELFRPQRW